MKLYLELDVDDLAFLKSDHSIAKTLEQVGKRIEDKEEQIISKRKIIVDDHQVGWWEVQ